jgi:hypothetical protein
MHRRIVDQISPQLEEGTIQTLLGFESIEGIVSMRTSASTAHFYAVELGIGIGGLPNPWFRDEFIHPKELVKWLERRPERNLSGAATRAERRARWPLAGRARRGRPACLCRPRLNCRDRALRRPPDYK